MICQDYYNTDFQVKYHDIRQELLNDLTAKNEILPDEEKYSEEDVDCICKKLYMDECSSIFYSEDFMDDKIDVGFRKVFDLLMLNEQFRTYIIELTNTYSTSNDETNGDMKYFSFISLFDVKIFYLTHQFISHYLKNGEIEQNIFQQIKERNTTFSEI